LYTASRNKGPIIPVKVFSYDLPVSQSTFVTYGRADGRQTTTMPRKEAVQHSCIAHQKPQNPLF